MTTLGEQRVRTKFNPSDLDGVGVIKNKTAELINLLQEERSKGPSSFVVGGEEDLKNQERQRLISIAQTTYEEAAMWAVKSVTI